MENKKDFVALNYFKNETVNIVDDNRARGLMHIEALAEFTWGFEEYVFIGEGDTFDEALSMAIGAAEEYLKEYPYFGDCDYTDSWEDIDPNFNL